MTAQDLEPGCYPCDQYATGETLPPREDILHTQYWRVAHAYWTTLPGWLVLLPVRHVEAFTDLPAEAMDELGGLVRDFSTALEEVTGCEKTYLMQFSEAVLHLHVHLVPRMPDQPGTARGPGVFTYLSEDETQWIPESDRDALALALRGSLERFRGGQHPTGVRRAPSP